jgi:hypothetical protein
MMSVWVSFTFPHSVLFVVLFWLAYHHNFDFSGYHTNYRRQRGVPGLISPSRISVDAAWVGGSRGVSRFTKSYPQVRELDGLHGILDTLHKSRMERGRQEGR